MTALQIMLFSFGLFLIILGIFLLFRTIDFKTKQKDFNTYGAIGIGTSRISPFRADDLDKPELSGVIPQEKIEMK